MPAHPLTDDECRQVLEIRAAHATDAEAAAAAGMNPASFKSRLRIARMRRHNDMPPDGHVVKGVSLLTDQDGHERGRWTKTTRAGRDEADTVHMPDPKIIKRRATLYDQAGQVTQQWVTEEPAAAERNVAWQHAAEAMAERLPRLRPITPPDVVNEDLLVGYPIADSHLGMLAWGAEAGADYDLPIAERLMGSAASYLVGMSPPAGTALVAFLGDMLHYDGLKPMTPQSGNILDADSRFPKMVQAAIRSMRRVIDLALARHAAVRVIVEPGNHDESTAFMLMMTIAAIYEHEPRLSVDTSPRTRHYFRFGECLIGTHHGDKIRMDLLPGIMARDEARAWGETTHRYWWTGHIHHSKQAAMSPRHSDEAGCSVESFRTLAAADAWHVGKGYLAPRDAKSIVFHNRHGEIARHTVTAAMLDAMRDSA